MKMKDKYIQSARWCAVLAVAACVGGCADDWDAHYDGVSRPTQTLWQEITSRPELADFAKLLKDRGYDRYLDSDQRYTVWAPTGQIDSMLVSGEYMSAEEVLVQIVENHIARGIIPASSVVNDTVVMLNGKPMPFVAEGGVPCLNGAAVSTANIECSNGDLHILGAQAPYNHNIWSYLRQDSEMSRLADYMYSFNRWVFSPELSTPGGIVNGQQMYVDSVFVQSNDLWQQFGYLNSEAYDYTMLVPDNTCWDKAMADFKSFFNYSSGNAAEGSEGLAETYAARNLLGALVFNMSDQDPQSDYWTSTGDLAFYRPYDAGGLFDGAEAANCSNGEVLKTGTLNLDPYQVLAKEIVIEAEDYGIYVVDGNYRDTDRPTRVAVSGTGLSSTAFMTFTSRSAVRGVEVTYVLPGVLSCAYDIGVVMVPTNMTQTGLSPSVEQKRMRLDVVLDDGYANERVEVEGLEYAGDKVDTVWVVRGHEFPYCDYYPDRTSFEDVPITLEITSSANRNESAYVRTLTMDCIVLKPTVN